MNAFAIDVRVAPNAAAGGAQPASLTVISRALCSRVTCRATCGCTPSLDARAEEAVFAQLTEESHAATKILISHRFSTVRMADDVLVLQDGHLVEKGDHASLMADDGLYAQKFRLQARGYVE